MGQINYSIAEVMVDSQYLKVLSPSYYFHDELLAGEQDKKKQT